MLASLSSLTHPQIFCVGVLTNLGTTRVFYKIVIVITQGDQKNKFYSKKTKQNKNGHNRTVLMQNITMKNIKLCIKHINEHTVKSFLKLSSNKTVKITKSTITSFELTALVKLPVRRLEVMTQVLRMQLTHMHMHAHMFRHNRCTCKRESYKEEREAGSDKAGEEEYMSGSWRGME